jgi:hypothetical protein
MSDWIGRLRARVEGEAALADYLSGDGSTG